MVTIKIITWTSLATGFFSIFRMADIVRQVNKWIMQVKEGNGQVRLVNWQVEEGNAQVRGGEGEILGDLNCKKKEYKRF